MFLNKASNIDILKYTHHIKLVKGAIESCFSDANKHKTNPEILKSQLIFDLIYELICFSSPLDTSEFKQFLTELESLQIFDTINSMLMETQYGIFNSELETVVRQCICCLKELVIMNVSKSCLLLRKNKFMELINKIYIKNVLNNESDFE